MLLNYSNENNIILKLYKINDKDNYPLLRAVIRNNIKIVKLLIDSANIKLKLKKAKKSGVYPLLLNTTDNNYNHEINNLLLDYAKKKSNNFKILII
ncbi:hypothetical protein H8356DRAFT_88065 [Neocallimastix lanati (nom. inval.)]|nr:hypothetical protein H8356DRAFT_88065 [Neocallimastix sp. JGI-2020a]